ncbi:MAG: sugar transferase [Clostridia bacterium]|nr:sugar transferase [Clostridia bacterium]
MKNTKQDKSVIEALSLEYYESMYKNKPVYEFFKRTFDIVASFFGILALSWLFLIIIVLILIIDKQNPFYLQERVGKDGKIFKIIKFQTMNSKDVRPLEEVLNSEQLAEYKENYKITHDPRVTKLGRLLRETSADELPQLLNILVGQMSIVGYRAVLEEELKDKYTEEEQKLLLKTTPGLTGFWASHGHGKRDVTYSDRVKMELYYCYKRNMALDLRILWRTFFSAAFINYDAS